MGNRIWVDFDDEEFAILSKAAERVEGDVHSLIRESSLAVSRGEIGEEVIAALEDRVRRRCERRHCRSGSDAHVDSEQCRALLEAVGVAAADSVANNQTRRPPEAQPLCEDVAKAQRELLIRSVKQAESLRQELGGDVFARGQSGQVWHES